jgi:hypothetical protein
MEFRKKTECTKIIYFFQRNINHNVQFQIFVTFCTEMRIDMKLR